MVLVTEVYNVLMGYLTIPGFQDPEIRCLPNRLSSLKPPAQVDHYAVPGKDCTKIYVKSGYKASG
ncbi:MAG: hypothetical protein ACYDBV_12255 [Nitrospiria bacterium]